MRASPRNDALNGKFRQKKPVRFLTTWNLAQRLKTSGPKIKQLMADGKLPQWLVVNGKPAWREDEINVWVSMGRPDADEFRRLKENASNKATRMFDPLPLGVLRIHRD